MSGYIKSKPFETQFDGDTVKARLKPLSFLDMVKVTEADRAKVLLVYQEILPQYVEDFTGLTDAGGNAISIQEVCTQAYFAQLASDLGSALIRAAVIDNPQKPAEESVS